MNQDSFIDQLTSDLQKSPPQSSSLRLILFMLLGSLGSGLLLIAVSNLRPDIRQALSTWSFIWEFSLLIALAIAAYGLAVRSLVPGVIHQTSRIWLGLGLIFAGLLQLIAQHPQGGVSSGFFGGAHCSLLIAINSLLPTIFALSMMRRGAPTRPRLSMALALSGSFGVAIAVQQWICPVDDPWHLMSWHVSLLPLALIAASCLGRRVLGW
jgi:hypothetical protein